MAQQFISLLKFRRGTKEKRLTTKFEEGEPVFEVDTRRMFIGVGDNDEADVGTATLGGTIVSNFTFIGPTDSNPEPDSEPKAYPGDLMYANNKLWRLGEGGYVDISPKTDNETISYNSENELYVLPDAFTVGGGAGISVAPGNIVSITSSADNVLQIVDDELTLTKGSITADYTSTDFFSSTEFVQRGPSWRINLNSNYFTVDTDIKIAKVPAGGKTDAVDTVDGVDVGTVNAIITDRFAQGNAMKTGIQLSQEYNPQISSELLVLNNETRNIVGLKLGVESFVTANDSTNTAYNGSASVDYDMVEWTGSTQQTVKVYDVEAVEDAGVLNESELTSAGFIILSSGTTKTKRAYRKLAIPVFALPGEPEVLYYSNVTDKTLIRGVNLAGVKLYYISDGVQTDIPITEINKVTSTGVYTAKWADVVTIPDGAAVYARTLTNTVTVDLENGPSILSVRNDGDFSMAEYSPVLKITGYNFGTTAADILVEYSTKTEPDTQVAMALTDDGISSLTDDQIELAPTFIDNTPNYSSLSTITVTVNGKTAFYDFE